MDNEVLLRIKNISNEFHEHDLQASDYRIIVQESAYSADADVLHDEENSQEIRVPLNIIKSNSSLQSIVHFLKTNLGMNFKSIADLLNRDQRTIWSSYNKAHSIGSAGQSKYSFPISILRSRRLSVLESIVFYLRNESALTYNEIADELGKNYRTIWTVYRRALEKIR